MIFVELSFDPDCPFTLRFYIIEKFHIKVRDSAGLRSPDSRVFLRGESSKCKRKDFSANCVTVPRQIAIYRYLRPRNFFLYVTSELRRRRLSESAIFRETGSARSWSLDGVYFYQSGRNTSHVVRRGERNQRRSSEICPIAKAANKKCQDDSLITQSPNTSSQKHNFSRFGRHRFFPDLFYLSPPFP